MRSGWISCLRGKSGVLPSMAKISGFHADNHLSIIISRIVIHNTSSRRGHNHKNASLSRVRQQPSQTFGDPASFQAKSLALTHSPQKSADQLFLGAIIVQQQQVETRPCHWKPGEIIPAICDFDS